jgi:Ca-activated chloride channel homolog
MSAFHFSHPGLLLLGLLLPPLLWWWLRRRQGVLRHPAASRLAALPRGRSRVAFWGGTALRFLSLLCLVLAAAEPRWPDLKTRINTEGIAIMMVADVSGSMATRDFDWKGQRVSRLEAVKNAFRLFVEGEKGAEGRLEGRPTDLIGLVVFGSQPEAVCPLTLSHSALLRLMDEQQPRSVPGESQTNLVDALALGLHPFLDAGPRRKVMILLTDGEHNVPDPSSGWNPGKAPKVAAALGIPVYVIDAGGLGLSNPEPGAREQSLAQREAAVKIMRNIARVTDGQYFRADNTAALLDVYRQIDQKERSTIESYQYRRYHEGAQWLGLASFILLALVLVLEMTVWRRVP